MEFQPHAYQKHCIDRILTTKKLALFLDMGLGKTVTTLTAVRELKEETGIVVGEKDEVSIINPFVFSSPGMTDEANALVYMSINRDTMPELSQSGAEGSEKFEGCRLVSLAEARKYLVDGKDEHGIYYPVYTWAALMFFVTCEFLKL